MDRSGASPTCVLGAAVRVALRSLDPARSITPKQLPRGPEAAYRSRVLQVTSHELSRRTRSVLRRIENGELLTVTARGLPAAELRPVDARDTWVPRKQFLALLGLDADANSSSEGKPAQ